MRCRSLVILTHALQGQGEGYFALALADIWRAEGRSVQVHQGLAKRPAAAHALLVHVDLTRTPPDYLAAATGYALPLNYRAADIAKRRVSRYLVSREDGYDGAVMVKTDRNASGLPERRLADRHGGALGRWARRLGDRLPPAWSGRFPALQYPVYPRKAQVPAWVWRQPGLVVERFLPERDGDDFVVHSAFFLGRHWIVSPTVAPAPVVKYDIVTRLLPLHEEPPASVVQAAADLGLDFGKIDYVIHGGEACVLDVNRTPYLGAYSENERTRQINACMAAGLDDFVL